MLDISFRSKSRTSVYYMCTLMEMVSCNCILPLIATFKISFIDGKMVNSFRLYWQDIWHVCFLLLYSLSYLENRYYHYHYSSFIFSTIYEGFYMFIFCIYLNYILFCTFLFLLFLFINVFIYLFIYLFWWSSFILMIAVKADERDTSGSTTME